jgi:hypothetical protein
MSHADIPNRPLARFSVFTEIQLRHLIAEKTEIEELLEQAFSLPDAVHGGDYLRATGRIWLWYLGSYELVRTMAGAESCFSDRATKKLLELKRYLAKVRMPLAKQEKRGTGKLATDELSSYIHFQASDIGYLIDGELVLFKEAAGKVVDSLMTIAKDDVIAPLSSKYQE